MSELRLVNANDDNIFRLDLNGYAGRMYACGWNGMVHVINELPTIDPETLPIVRELREKLENAEKEIEALKGVGSPNCISCDMMHQNGNCLDVGGFCTAVPAAYCKLIPELREKLARYEQAEKEGRLIMSPVAMGQKIYHVFLYKNNVPSHINEETVVGLHLRDDENMRCRKSGEYMITRCNGYLSHIRLKEIGKTVFLTREEAENALKGVDKDDPETIY